MASPVPHAKISSPETTIRIWRLNLQGLELANVLVDQIIDKKGSNILLLDIRDQAIFADFFILCNGESDRQLQALTEGVTEEVKKKTDLIPWGVEGEPEGGWILVDYGAVLIHIFSPEKRRYYNLEELWRDAHVVLRMP